MKKKTSWLLGLLCAMVFSVAFGVSFRGNAASADLAQPTVSRGMRVESVEDWSEVSGDASITVRFDETQATEGGFLAIDLKVEESLLDGSPNMYTPKLKIDGKDILDGDGKNFRFYNRNGNPYNVEYKFGGFLFLPKDANGILYIPMEDLIAEEGAISSFSSLTLLFSNHARTGKALYYSIFTAEEFAEQANETNTLFNFSLVGTNENGEVTDSYISAKKLLLTSSASKQAGYASYQKEIFTVTTPTDSFANTYFTVNFPETDIATGEYLAIDLKVQNILCTGGASANYCFQLKVNGATLQQPVNVYKQTFGAEFGVYQRSGSGVGYFGNGVWFFLNADVDALLYIPADKLLTGTSSANATLQTKLSSVTIDYASGNVGRQSMVVYNGVFKASAVGETMSEQNCLYDFTGVKTDENGNINDQTIEISRLIGKLEKTSETRFVADMVHAFNQETTYIKALGGDEYIARLTPANGKLGSADVLALSLRASRFVGQSASMKITVKMQGDNAVYGLLNDAKIPVYGEDEAKGYSVKNGEISLLEGDDTTAYIPLRFLTADGSAYLTDSIAEKFGKDGQIEYIEITYVGGDVALGGVCLLRADGGKSVTYDLSGEFALLSNTAEVLQAHYDTVALFVNGEQIPSQNGVLTANVYGSVVSVEETLDFYAAARLSFALRSGVQVVSVQTATDENGANGKQWLEETSVINGLAVVARPLDGTLALTPQTLYIYVTLTGNRSYLIAPEKTVKNVNDAPVFEFNAKTEYVDDTDVSYEWFVDGEKQGEEKAFSFSPNSVGVYVVELRVNGEIIGSRSVSVIDGEVKEFADGQIVGAQYVEQKTGGFYVSTPDNWSSQDAAFTVQFNETNVQGKYLAIDLKVEGIVYGSSILSSQHQYTVKFGINGGILSQVNESVMQVFTGVNRGGNPVDVDFKFGNWLFIPEKFDGVLYVPAESLLNASGLQETLSSFTVSYAGGNTQKFSTVAYNYVYLADEIGDGYQDGELLINYRALQTAENGVITDQRFTASGDLLVKNTFKSQSVWTANVIELDDAYENSVKLGVKTEQLGGVAITEPYEFGWAEARVDAFTPHDGFAVQVYAPSGVCYFKMVFEDENGKFWKVDISPLSEKINTDSFRLTYQEEVSYIKGGYGCFYLASKQIGTLYVPYDKLVPLTDGADFKGDDYTAGTKLGKIVAVYFGMDMKNGLGRTLAVGTFADVDLQNKQLRYVFGTSFMSDRELNVASPSTGAAFRSSSTAAHDKNWTWSRLIDREMPGYINKDAIIALVALCNTLNKADYTEASWSSFYGKFVVAKSVAENPFATQKDVNDATSALSVAKFQLLRLTDVAPAADSGCAAENGWASASVAILTAAAVAFVFGKKKENTK